MKQEINVFANNTSAIKKILKENFPTATFRIKTKLFSGGKSIDIYTSLLADIDYNRKRELEMKLQDNGLDESEWIELQEIERDIDWNEDIRQKIKSLLKDYWSVDYDEITGEVLSGGNCYLFVEPFSRF